MKPTFFKLLGILAAIAVLLVNGSQLTSDAAETYPVKPLRLIIPFAPGGVTDIVGRLIATKLTDRLGKQVVTENHAGAGGIVGLEMASRANPDGYTLCMITMSYAFKPALYKKLPYDPVKSFAPVANIASGMAAMVVHPSVPAKTVGEFIALAKKKPGQLVCGAAGVGSVSHMMGELFKQKTGVDFKIVQFKGAGPATVDLLGGHSHLTFTSLISLMPHIKAEKLRPLGICGGKRSALLPDVPTIKESGVPGYEVRDWWGMAAPAGTPASIIDRLTSEIKAILIMEDVKKQFLNNGAEPEYLSPLDFGKFIENEILNWTDVIKRANIKLE